MICERRESKISLGTQSLVCQRFVVFPAPQADSVFRFEASDDPPAVKVLFRARSGSCQQTHARWRDRHDLSRGLWSVALLARTRGCSRRFSASWAVNGGILVSNAQEVSPSRLEVVAVALDPAHYRRHCHLSASAEIHAARDCRIRCDCMVCQTPPKRLKATGRLINIADILNRHFDGFNDTAKVFIDSPSGCR